MLRECYSTKLNRKLRVVTIPDWSMESDTDSDKIWGRYLYYNVVSRIGQKRFSIYYSDEVKFLDNWFKDTEVYEYITYRTFERATMFDGLSATKIRKAFIDKDIDYIKKYCPPSVVSRFDELASYYDIVTQNPKEDFSMQ